MNIFILLDPVQINSDQRMSKLLFDSNGIPQGAMIQPGFFCIAYCQEPHTVKSKEKLEKSKLELNMPL